MPGHSTSESELLGMWGVPHLLVDPLTYLWRPKAMEWDDAAVLSQCSTAQGPSDSSLKGRT